MDSKGFSLRKTENGVVIAMGGTTIIRFLPGNYDPQSGKFVDIEPFFDADDVLLHELWHAARAMQGVARLELTGDEYDDLEEFFAGTRFKCVPFRNRTKSSVTRGARPFVNCKIKAEFGGVLDEIYGAYLQIKASGSNIF